jgi:hypothetical protein
VQVDDGNGGTDTITVNVNIAAQNDAPVITVSITLPPGSTVADYKIVSLPLKPQNPDPLVFLGSQIGAYEPGLMRIAIFDAEIQDFLEYPFTGLDDPAEPGDAAWFLFRDGKTLTFQGAHTPVSPGPLEEGEGYYKTISSGWNLIGNPYEYEIGINSILIKEGSTVVPLMLPDNSITQPVFWIWINGEYVPASTLSPGGGGWLLKHEPGDAQVFFPALAAARSTSRQTVVDTVGLERPPAPPGLLSQDAPVETEKSGGGCFIDSAGYGEKPGSWFGYGVLALFISTFFAVFSHRRIQARR